MRLFWIALIAALLVSCAKPPTVANSQAAANGSGLPDYTVRVGVAVRTSSRTCVAIKNQVLLASSPITLVSPVSPQTFFEAWITGPSSSNCPIAKEVAPGMVSYEISAPPSPEIPKLTPLIAVAGATAASAFHLDNNNVQADLDQIQAVNTFRACGADDGIHLSVWRGAPIAGKLLWTASYYEPGNPGTLPTCTAAELAPPASAKP